MTTDNIRQLFLEFFKSKGHEIVPSDSLVPKDDPTLLFTGAGMNQFKDKFLGKNVTYNRAASCQKCLRTGDLENVGRTPSHHTFFEMLGNFSFGDYFKKEAIQWAWEFLTEGLKLKAESLWVSIYKDDKGAYDIWRDIVKVPEKRILKFGAKENFWPSEAPTKGPNGPCGPCSEIFYDWGEGNLVEIWNLVFTQFDRQPNGSLKPLPNKNIDTGMGLERLASVMQGVKTNFEIDIFRPVIKVIAESCKLKAESSKINAIADHIRAATFAIADGVMPSNTDRGYVVRKLIRRSQNYALQLGIKAPLLYKLVSAVADVMKNPYPELVSKREDIAQWVKKEVEEFLITVQVQIPKVEEAFGKFRGLAPGDRGQDKLAEIAFNFYDTYGMPYEMLEEIAERFKLKIDREKFEKLLEKQRSLSRSKSKIKGEIFSETFEKKVASLGLRTEFLGYEESRADAKVLEVLEGGEVILDKTPFYGESGGQVGDWGRIETNSGVMEVLDAKKIGETIVHIGEMKRGRILKGEAAKVEIDEDARNRTMRNHTATHLLQAALRKVLGGHVRQTGSLVDAEHLRFDFTHMKKMEERELTRAEEFVNENIKKAIPVKKEIRDLEDAKKEGAVALFDEKYDKKVRVVTIRDVSKELCGGTHVDNTKDIGVFKIASESSIASGIRRIEALTGELALEWAAKQKETEGLKLRAQSEKEEKKKRMAERLREEFGRLDAYIAKGKDINGVKVICEMVPDADMEILRNLSDKIRSKERSAVIILAAKGSDKVSFVVSVTDDLVKRKTVTANELAKALAKDIGGSGGGRLDFAQGGGKDVAKLEDSLRKVSEIMEERLR